MTPKDDIRIALKLLETIAQLESILWERYRKDLLDLIQDQYDGKTSQGCKEPDYRPF